MGAVDEGPGLESKLSMFKTEEEKRSADYHQLLDQLASWKLEQGNTDEARIYYKELAELRREELREAAHNARDIEIPKYESSSAEINEAAGHKSDDWEERDWEQEPRTQFKPAKETEYSLRKHSNSKQDTVPSSTRPKKSERTHLNLESESDSGYAGVTWTGGFDHCLEMGGLTSDIRTAELQELLDGLMEEQKNAPKPYIRWVDDNHAVLVCGNVTSANTLLATCLRDGLTVRPFSDATQASKQLSTSDLLPPKERPKTTAVIARRLLSHALQNPSLRDKKAEKELAAARLKAREARRERPANATDAWDD